MMLSMNVINRQNRQPILTLDHGFRIKGTVKKLGVDHSGLVQLFERTSGILVAQVTSDKFGKYEFTNLSNLFEFMIIAKDPNRQFNAVIQDNVVPK